MSPVQVPLGQKTFEVLKRREKRNAKKTTPVEDPSKSSK